MAAYSPSERPIPFLKWAGGKRSLLGEILPRLPEFSPVYIEPFLGGGAVFLALAKAGRIGRAILADRNPELIHAWTMVRDAPDALAQAILALGEPNEERFYEIRGTAPRKDIARAARLLWLNRTCFNGLYRLNRSGGFNVPFGRYKRVKLVDLENLHAVSDALTTTRAELRVADFRGLDLPDLNPDTTVYADPPYLPASATAKFTDYDGQPFALEAHTALADWFVELRRRGVHGLLSNACTPESEALYRARALDLTQVQVRRSINRDISRRGPVPELLVSVNLEDVEADVLTGAPDGNP